MSALLARETKGVELSEIRRSFNKGVAMSRALISLLAALSAASCTTHPQVSAQDRTLSFGCNDVVVIGNVKDEAEEPSSSEIDLLGHSWFSATLNVKRIVRGANLPPILPVSYYGHAALRQDLDFMLVLKRTAEGYEITTGQLMWLRPHLADRCG